MADNSAAVERTAARIKKSQPNLTHREARQRAVESVLRVERKQKK